MIKKKNCFLFVLSSRCRLSCIIYICLYTLLWFLVLRGFVFDVQSVFMGLKTQNMRSQIVTNRCLIFAVLACVCIFQRLNDTPGSCIDIYLTYVSNWYVNLDELDTCLISWTHSYFIQITRRRHWHVCFCIHIYIPVYLVHSEVKKRG